MKITVTGTGYVAKGNPKVLATYNILPGSKSSNKFKLIGKCIVSTIKPKELIGLKAGYM